MELLMVLRRPRRIVIPSASELARTRPDRLTLTSRLPQLPTLTLQPCDCPVNAVEKSGHDTSCMKTKTARNIANGCFLCVVAALSILGGNSNLSDKIREFANLPAGSSRL